MNDVSDCRSSVYCGRLYLCSSWHSTLSGLRETERLVWPAVRRRLYRTKESGMQSNRVIGRNLIATGIAIVISSFVVFLVRTEMNSSLAAASTESEGSK